MAYLGERRNLLERQPGKKFFGFCQQPDSDLVLLTFASELVLVQPYDNKVIRSWTCPKTKGQYFSNAAVFSPEDKEFVAVQDRKTLRTFKESDLQQTETFTLKHKIHCLVPCCHRSPFVMLEDGSLFQLYLVLEDPGEIVPDRSLKIKPDKILFAASFIQDDGSSLVCSICEVKNTYKALVSIFHTEENEPDHRHAALECGDSTLIAATAYHESTNPIISTIWSDGSLRQLKIELSPEGKLEVQLEKIATIEVDDNVSISAISPDQVVVLSSGRLKVVDLKYGSVLQEIEIDTEVTEIFTVGEHIFLDTRNEIQKIQFSAIPVTLASAILKHKESRQITQVHHAQWTDPPGQSSIFGDRDSDFIEILLKTKQDVNFDKSWMRFWKGRTEEFRKEFCRSKMMKQILSRFGTNDKTKNFWPRNTISKIVSTGLLNGRWCDGVFAQILAKRDWDLLLDCLQKVNDIPEHTMAQCLTHLAKSKDDDKEAMECDSPVSPQVRSCINEILQLPYSENLLRKELTAMPFQPVMAFVTFLTSLLEELSLASTAPTLDQVVCWLSLIIDAHLSEIVLLEDSWPAIQRLQEAVVLQSTIFKELTEVSKLLVKIQCKIPNAGKVVSKSLYSVEIMRF